MLQCLSQLTELIATGIGVQEICTSIGADTLGYISEDGMIEATGQPRERLCTACFTGDYPIPLADEGERGKGLLEPVAVTEKNLKEVLVGSGYYTEDQIK